MGSTVVSATVGAIGSNTTLTVTAAMPAAISVTPATPSIAKATTQQFVATSYLQRLHDANAHGRGDLGVLDDGHNYDLERGGSKGLAASVAAGTSTISATLGR